MQVLPHRGKVYPYLRELYPSIIAHSASCANPKSSTALRLFAITVVFAGGCHPGWKWDLPVVISEILSFDARTHTPVASMVHLAVSSRRTSVFPKHGLGRRYTTPPSTASEERGISRLQYSFIPSGLKVCSPHRLFRPYILWVT